MYKNKTKGTVEKEIRKFTLRGETVSLLEGESGLTLVHQEDLLEAYDEVDCPKVGSMWVMDGRVHYVHSIAQNKDTDVVNIYSQSINFNFTSDLTEFITRAIPFAVEEGQRCRPAELCKRTGPWGIITEVGTTIEIQIGGELKSVSKRDLARFWQPSTTILKHSL